MKKTTNNAPAEGREVLIGCRGDDPAGRDTFVMRILPLQEGLDIENAVHQASVAFVKGSGFPLFAEQSGRFSWRDFERHVPNEICRQYGFEVVRSLPKCDLCVIADMNLADLIDVAFHVHNIEWDVDEEDGDRSDVSGLNLPESVFVPYVVFLHPREALSDVSRDDLIERVADYLSDKYSFCICNLTIE